MDDDQFDRFLRRSLRRHPAPQRLRGRVVAAIRRAANAGHAVRPGVWVGAAAALVVLALLAPSARRATVGPGTPGPIDGRERVIVPAASGEERTWEGRLVCLACAARGRDLASQRLCPIGPGHETGLQTADGRLWSLRWASGGTTSLADPARRGLGVRLRALVAGDASVLVVSAAHLL